MFPEALIQDIIDLVGQTAVAHPEFMLPKGNCIASWFPNLQLQSAMTQQSADGFRLAADPIVEAK